MIDRIRKAQDEDSGFTLIELLVVVIIIGILAAIAIPVFLNQRESAWRSAAESDARNAAMDVETYFTSERAYPDGLDDTEAISSDGVTLSYGEADGLYCIQADHDNLDESIYYDSAEGGMADACNSGGDLTEYSDV